MSHVLVLVSALLAAAPLAAASTPSAIDLPAPRRTGGLPLMEALARRATARAFDTRALTPQQLGDALWAGFGINRPDGKRTAPSSMDKRELSIYVLLPQGAFVYEPQRHRLEPVVPGDLRALGGRQDFVRDAPVTLVYVADRERMTKGSPEEQEATASFDTGFVSQNVYLYCASEGLATGVRAWVDRDTLGKALGLRAGQLITAAQSIGHPKR